MSTINVQFSDSSEAAIKAIFCGPQDASYFPNQGNVDATDARWKTYYESLPPALQGFVPSPE
jgi:hypothetical protein